MSSASTRPAAEVRPVAGKGNGLIAVRDLKAGDVILVDQPSMVFEVKDVGPKIGDLRKEVKRLSAAERQAFGSLAEGNPARWSDPKMRKLMTNCYAEGKGSTRQIRLFMKIAMINHSCIPNSIVTSSGVRTASNTEGSTVRAVSDISAGSEITIQYHKALSFMDHAERDRYLVSLWNISCQCPACDTGLESFSASESRRQTLRVAFFKALNCEIPDLRVEALDQRSPSYSAEYKLLPQDQQLRFADRVKHAMTAVGILRGDNQFDTLIMLQSDIVKEMASYLRVARQIGEGDAVEQCLPFFDRLLKDFIYATAITGGFGAPDILRAQAIRKEFGLDEISLAGAGGGLSQAGVADTN